MKRVLAYVRSFGAVGALSTLALTTFGLGVQNALSLVNGNAPNPPSQAPEIGHAGSLVALLAVIAFAALVWERRRRRQKA